MNSRVAVILGAGAMILVAGGIGWFWLNAGRPKEPVKVVYDEAKFPPPPAADSTPPTAPKPATTAPVRPVTEPPKPVAEPPQPAAPTTGTLLITSDVPDTSVFIDRVYLGTTPVTAKNLTPGTHHLNMSATGYDGISEDITVDVGSHEISRSFKTLKLDATLAVVHKHAFGSCKGTLHATPDGIVYDTTNKDDKFSVALTDIDTFEVDYVAKTMTLKIKKGKTYKFTDPDDNADHLFVFHRDVDAVRKKLSAPRTSHDALRTTH